MTTIVEHDRSLAVEGRYHLGQPVEFMVHVVECGIRQPLDIFCWNTQSFFTIHGKHLAIVKGIGHGLLMLVVLVGDDQHKGLVLYFGIDGNTGVYIVGSHQMAIGHC